MSVPYRLLTTRRSGPVERLTLNRPDVRNAFNDALIEELLDWTRAAAVDDSIRVVVLSGNGAAFCAGGDIEWMTRVGAQTLDENLRDAGRAAELFTALDALPKAVVGRIHGAAIGGGAGLAAVCDVVVAAESTTFAFPEVTLGILPAVIAPFVVAKIGPSAARELFLTGRRFSAAHAQSIGLAHVMTPDAELDTHVDACVRELLGAAPSAVAATKALLARLDTAAPEARPGLTAEALATQRASTEGREGLRAFLEKRRPSWHVPPHPDR